MHTLIITHSGTKGNTNALSSNGMNIVDWYISSQKEFTDLIHKDETVSKLLLRVYAAISTENKAIKSRKESPDNNESSLCGIALGSPLSYLLTHLLTHFYSLVGEIPKPSNLTETLLLKSLELLLNTFDPNSVQASVILDSLLDTFCSAVDSTRLFVGTYPAEKTKKSNNITITEYVYERMFEVITNKYLNADREIGSKAVSLLLALAVTDSNINSVVRLIKVLMDNTQFTLAPSMLKICSKFNTSILCRADRVSPEQSNLTPLRVALRDTARIEVRMSDQYEVTVRRSPNHESDVLTELKCDSTWLVSAISNGWAKLNPCEKNRLIAGTDCRCWSSEFDIETECFIPFLAQDRIMFSVIHSDVPLVCRLHVGLYARTEKNLEFGTRTESTMDEGAEYEITEIVDGWAEISSRENERLGLESRDQPYYCRVFDDSTYESFMWVVKTKSESEMPDPDSIAYSGHEHHLTRVSSRTLPIEYGGSMFECNICRMVGQGYMYRCSLCNFDAHPTCVIVTKPDDTQPEIVTERVDPTSSNKEGAIVEVNNVYEESYLHNATDSYQFLLSALPFIYRKNKLGIREKDLRTVIATLIDIVDSHLSSTGPKCGATGVIKSSLNLISLILDSCKKGSHVDATYPKLFKAGDIVKRGEHWKGYDEDRLHNQCGLGKVIGYSLGGDVIVCWLESSLTVSYNYCYDSLRSLKRESTAMKLQMDIVPVNRDKIDKLFFAALYDCSSNNDHFHRLQQSDDAVDMTLLNSVTGDIVDLVIPNIDCFFKPNSPEQYDLISTLLEKDMHHKLNDEFKPLLLLTLTEMKSTSILRMLNHDVDNFRDEYTSKILSNSLEYITTRVLFYITFHTYIYSLFCPVSRII